jgi:hypothetical protein
MPSLMGWFFLILLALIAFNVVLTYRRWRTPPMEQPDDLRRADDGLRSDRDGPERQAGRSTWIHLNKWPPDDPPSKP